IGQVRRKENCSLFEKRHKFFVDIPVTNSMRKAIDSGPHQILGVCEAVDMCNCLEFVPVGFVNDGAIDGWRQLLYRSISVIDPELDEVHSPRRQALHNSYGL